MTIFSSSRMERTLKIFDNVTVEPETLLISSCPFASGWPTVQMVPIGTVDFHVCLVFIYARNIRLHHLNQRTFIK